MFWTATQGHLSIIGKPGITNHTCRSVVESHSIWGDIELCVTLWREMRISPAMQSNQQEIEVARKTLARDIKMRLAEREIGVQEARDGMRDCFVSSYLGGVSQGLSQFDIKGNPDSVAKVIEAMFRKRLRNAGSSWTNPSVEALQSVKDELDEETRLDELPAELKSVHDQVCTLLIGKARGDLQHHGNVSAVVRPPAQVATSSEQVSQKNSESPVLAALRSAIDAQLSQMQKIAQSSEANFHIRLEEEIGQLQTLLGTAHAFVSSGA